MARNPPARWPVRRRWKPQRTRQGIRALQPFLISNNAESAGVVRDQVSPVSTSATATNVVTWATNPTAGAKVLLALGVNSSTPPTSVVDNGTSATTFTLDESAGSAAGIFIYRGDAITLPASGQYKVTVTWAAAHASYAVGQSYLGLAAGGPVASVASPGSAGSTAPNTGAIAGGYSAGAYFAAFEDSTGLNPESITLNAAGFQAVGVNANGSAFQAGGAADLLANGVAAQTCAWTLGDSVPWNAIMVAYAPATPTLASVANSGGISGIPFDFVGNGGANGSLTYDLADAAHGAASYAVQCGPTNTQIDLVWQAGPGQPTRQIAEPQPQYWYRIYLKFAAYPTSGNLSVIQMFGGGLLIITTAGKIQLVDSTLGQQAIFTTSIPLGQWFRVEGFCSNGHGNGVMSASRYDAFDSTTPTESQSSSTCTNDVLTVIAFGNVFFGISNIAFLMDDIAVSNIGPIGPALGSIPQFAALSGTGMLGAPASVNVPAAAALSGSGSLTAQPVINVPAAAALSGSGSLTAQPVVGVPLAAALSGSGVLTAAAAVNFKVAAALSGVGVLAANDVVNFNVAAALSGAGALAATPAVGVEAAAALSGTGVLTASGIVNVPLAAALSGLGVLGAPVIVNLEIAAALSGTGALTATATVGTPGVNALAALSGLGVLLATAIAPPPPLFGPGPVPLNPTVRYFPPGIRRVYWLAAVANPAAPARAELDAGTDLTSEITAMAGWGGVAAVVEAANFGARFTEQLAGRLALPPSSVTCFMSQDGRDVRSVLAHGMFGYIAALWEGDISGLLMDVYPVRVASVETDSTVEDPGRVVVSFTGSRSPALSVPVPSY